jgi:hypothetical protein
MLDAADGRATQSMRQVNSSNARKRAICAIILIFHLSDVHMPDLDATTDARPGCKRPVDRARFAQPSRASSSCCLISSGLYPQPRTASVTISHS